MSVIVSLLAGAGFKNISKGVSDLASSGVNPQALMSDPNLKLLLAGAGIRDTANSMEVIQPMMQMLNPPKPPPPPSPAEMGAAMQMLSAQLGGGQSGLQPPMPAGGPGMGPPIGAGY